MSDLACRRVVVVIIDGLRPDAIDAFDLVHIQALERGGAGTREAQTVRPSVTAAAMASLLSGVPPECHGFRSDRFHLPRPSVTLHPMPAVLLAAGVITTAVLARPPILYRRFGRALAEQAGLHATHFVEGSALEIARATEAVLATQQNGLILCHVPDADQAGHAHGWMSEAYAMAARRADEAFGIIHRAAREPGHDDTLVMLCADHGGGGAVPNDHDSAHPFDRTIPIIMAGGGVLAGMRLANATLLDIPATVFAALRVPRPACYVGRSLLEDVRELVYAA